MFVDKVRKAVEAYGLLKKGERVLVAYSGGIDSTALLAVLRELQQTWSLDLMLAHFNHRLRKNAEDEERFVRQVSRKYSLPLFVGSEDVRSFARMKGMNLEETGRELRYAFLKRTAEKCSASKIATGHTMTDQAETFLMRLMRGSGARGLGGIYPLIEGTIIRPLLFVEREEIEAYLSEHSLPYRVDESNFDRRFLRNRVRLELIPFLREKFDPKIIPHLSQLASVLREEDQLLDSLAEKKAEKVLLKKGKHVQVDTAALSSLPRAIQRRVVRLFLLKTAGSLRGVAYSDVESLLNLKQGKEFHLWRKFRFRRESGHISLREQNLGSAAYEYSWSGEEPLWIREPGLRFKAEKVRKPAVSRLGFDDQSRVYLDLDRLTFPLTVRSRKAGDRYQPLGAPGKNKLKEIMRAKGIPASERTKNPVFLSGNDIVWVLGLPVSDKYKIRKNTLDILLIQKA